MSAVVHINDVAVCSGSVRFGLQGAWYASLTMDGTDASAVAGAVDLELGETTLSGFATPGLDEGNLLTVEMVGGAGGLQVEVEPKHYENATLRVVATDILSAGDESLSPTSDSAALDAFLPMWTTLRAPAADALWRVVEKAGATWRTLPDGKVWIGTPTWSAVEPEHVLTDEDPTQSSLTIAVEGADVLPGDTFLEHRISGAIYDIDDTSIRATLTYGEQRSGIAAALGPVVRSEVAHLDYAIPFVAKIAAQNSDGTLELQSTDDRFPGMSKIPLRCMPGVTTMTVLPGTFVVVAFDGADGSKPRASVVDLTQARAVTFTVTETFEVVATTVKAGGSLSLTIQDELQTWIGLLTTAGSSVGLTVPAYAGVGTTITKGQ